MMDLLHLRCQIINISKRSPINAHKNGILCYKIEKALQASYLNNLNNIVTCNMSWYTLFGISKTWLLKICKHTLNLYCCFLSTYRVHMYNNPVVADLVKYMSDVDHRDWLHRYTNLVLYSGR